MVKWFPILEGFVLVTYLSLHFFMIRLEESSV